MATQTMVLTVKISNTERLRIKAMKIVVATKGVTSVQFPKEQENLTVEGEDLDIVAVVQTLRKKVGKTDVFKVTPASQAPASQAPASPVFQQTMVLTVKISNSERLRNKALKIARGTAGVTLAQFPKEQENLTVEGEDVDIVALVQILRKKVGKTDVFEVTPV